MPSSFSDSFDRPDAATLGGNWGASYTSADPIAIAGNLAQPTTTSVDAVETVRSTQFTPNQSAQVTIATLTGGVSLMAISILLRASLGPAQTWYEIMLRQNSSFTSRIAYRLGGSIQVSTTENATTWLPTDVLGGDVIGKTIRLLRNGSVVLTLDDGSLDSGLVGMSLNNQTGVMGLLQVNDFSALSLGTSRFFPSGAGEGIMVYKPWSGLRVD